MNYLRKVFDYFGWTWPSFWPFSKPTTTGIGVRSKKTLKWFLIIAIGGGIILKWIYGDSGSGISPTTWVLVIVALLWLINQFSGSGLSTNISQLGKGWLMPLVIAIAILMILAEVFPDWWKNASWTSILLIVGLIVLLYMMKKYKVDGRVFIGVGLVLLFLKPGCQSFGGKDGHKPSKIEAAQISSIVREIDTIVKLTGSKDFYFQTGPYMDYDILAVTTGKGFWWRKDAVVYFEIPAGKVFNADEEGRATALHPDNGSTEDVAFGLFRVWGTGSVHIKTTWQKPEAKAKIASN